jgi:hypothetical protein
MTIKSMLEFFFISHHVWIESTILEYFFGLTIYVYWCIQKYFPGLTMCMIEVQKYFPGLTVRPRKCVCILIQYTWKFEFWNDPAMMPLPWAASSIKTEDYFPASTSSVSLLVEECLIGKITICQLSSLLGRVLHWLASLSDGLLIVISPPCCSHSCHVLLFRCVTLTPSIMQKCGSTYRKYALELATCPWS